LRWGRANLGKVLRSQRKGRTAAIHFPFEKGRTVFSKLIELQNSLIECFVEKIDSHQWWLKRKVVSKENPPDEQRNVYIKDV